MHITIKYYNSSVFGFVRYFYFYYTAIKNDTVVIRFNISWHSLRLSHTEMILGPIVKAVNCKNVNTILFFFYVTI